MSEEIPDSVTVTMRTEKVPPLIDGSEIRDCEVCGHDVVVSPATLEEIEAGVYPDYVICLQCAHDHA